MRQRGTGVSLEAMPTTNARAQTVFLAPGRWTLIPAESRVEFSIKHLLVAKVRGRFTGFEGDLLSSADGIRAHGTVDVASLDTEDPRRDAHLRRPDFLDAERHRWMRFSCEHLDVVDAKRAHVNGTMTVAGATHPLTFDLTVVSRPAPDRVRLRASGTLRRSDFGITPKSLLEAGVSDQVGLVLELTAARAR
jgi:polyisoprenoid-binding protein YceI